MDLQDLQLRYDDYNKQAYSWPEDERVGNKEYLDTLNLRHETFVRFMKLFGRRERLLEYTIEKMSEKEIIPEQVVLCVLNENGTRFFNSTKELMEHKNGKAVTNLVAACMSFWQGSEERFLEQSPEDLGGDENTESQKTV
jgi:hypothetical protein